MLYGIPESKAEATNWFLLILWALFGNDDDGVAGQRSKKEGYSEKPTFWQFLRWVFRNPHHNLSFSVLLRPVVNPKWIIRTKSFELRFNPFWFRLGYLFFGWREDSPSALGWGGKYGSHGGKFDIGIKDLT